MRIYVLRHVESAAMRWRMDNPDAEDVIAELLPDSIVGVSALGEEQIEALALHFAALPKNEQPTHAFGSPFNRTVLTGEGALSKLDNEIILVHDDRLREIDFGIFAMLTKKGRAAKFPSEWAERRRVGKINYRPQDGENWFDVGDRFVDFQRDKIDALPDDAVVLLSTHETLVSASQWKWGGEDVEELGRQAVPSASITTYDYKDGKFTLVSKHVLPKSPSGKDLFSAESKKDDA